MSVWQSYPAEVVLSKILVRGGAFTARHAFGAEPEKNRYFIILNASPSTDSLLLIATTTTQEEKRRKARHYAVIVTIEPTEYEDLSERYVIDCCSLLKWQRKQLDDKAALHAIQPLSPVPSTVMDRLTAAIALVPVLSPEEKRLVLGSQQA